MKNKLVLISFLIFLLFIHIGGKAESNQPMSGILGVKWGATATDFLKNIQSEGELKQSGLYPQYILKKHQILGVPVTIIFEFTDGKANFNKNWAKMGKSNYDNFFLDKVTIKFERKDYKKIYKHFRKIYGKPQTHKRKTMSFISDLVASQKAKRINVTFHNVYWLNTAIGRKVTILSPGPIPVKPPASLSRLPSRPQRYNETYFESSTVEFQKINK